VKYTIFADTNVFLDAILLRVEGGTDCREILEMAQDREIKVCTSSSCLLNVLYFLQKAGVTSQEIIEIVESLLEVISLLSTDEKTFISALHAGFSDLEDAVQYHTALHIKDINYFITSNIKDFKKAPTQLPVLTPKQFIKKYNG